MKPMSEQHFAILRRHMVEVIAIHADRMEEEIGKAALDKRVLAAMSGVPRHFFVPEDLAEFAHHDTPLPIGFNKTISQPFITALMADLLALEPHHAMLEIGTGRGYQTAVLAELVDQVWSVEIVEEFATAAEVLLNQLGYTKVGIRVGDGSRGWAEHAPYDRIIVSAAAERLPPALLEQLKPGGRLVMPLGAPEEQHLTMIIKDAAGQTSMRKFIPVRFSRLETVL